VEKAKEMSKALLSLGATSAQADKNGTTAFHRYVTANAQSLLETLWENDPVGTNTAIHHIAFANSATCENPLQAAIKNGNLAVILKLLDRGAVPQIEFEAWYVLLALDIPLLLVKRPIDVVYSHSTIPLRSIFGNPAANPRITRLKSAKQSTAMENQLRTFEDNQNRYKQMVQQPLILALQSSKPEIAIELLERGADPNVVNNSAQYYMQASWASRFTGESALDIANNQIKALSEYNENAARRRTRSPTMPQGTDRYLKKYEEGTYEHWAISKEIKKLRKSYEKELKKYEKDKVLDDRASGFKEKDAAVAEAKKRMEKVRDALLAKGAKTFREIYPEFNSRLESTRHQQYYNNLDSNNIQAPFKYVFSFRNVNDVTSARNVAYHKL
jgi:ankyrin repeat protein